MHVEAVPYPIHTGLTDSGLPFAGLLKHRSGPTATWRGHPFAHACQRYHIEHWRYPDPSSVDQRAGRADETTIKDATVKRYHYDRHDQLQLCIDAYHHAHRLKTLHGLTPYAYIGKIWTPQPHRFKLNPVPHIRRLNF
jgi:hypothetical protein